MKTKICCKCKIEKSITEFTIDNKNKDGLFYWCNQCKESREIFYGQGSVKYLGWLWCFRYKNYCKRVARNCPKNTKRY